MQKHMGKPNTALFVGDLKKYALTVILSKGMRKTIPCVCEKTQGNKEGQNICVNYYDYNP